MTNLGRTVKWTEEGIEYEADPRHRENVLDYFGLEAGGKPLSHNGDKENKMEEWEKEPLCKEEANIFRGLAATFNFRGQDCPNLQFPTKQCSREMANPNLASWKSLKRWPGTWWELRERFGNSDGRDLKKGRGWSRILTGEER